MNIKGAWSPAGDKASMVASVLWRSPEEMTWLRTYKQYILGHTEFKTLLLIDISVIQHYCCNMIPNLIDLPRAPWLVLPAGIHQANLSAVADRFASNTWRRHLFHGLVQASQNLAQAGCQRLFLDGSFVTDKPKPGDYDACWDPIGVDRRLMDPVFSNFAEGRAAQKAKFNGEFFPSTTRADATGRTFVDFFQVEKFSGLPKGIVLLNLVNDPML